MCNVIGFADFLENRAFRTPSSVSPQQRHLQVNFTRRDREDLEGWSSDEHRVSFSASEMGAFAMLYEAGRPWASWGVVRQGRAILLWDCVTLADIGQFPNMVDALAALPAGDVPAPVANVIRFVEARIAPPLS